MNFILEGGSVSLLQNKIHYITHLCLQMKRQYGNLYVGWQCLERYKGWQRHAGTKTAKQWGTDCQPSYLKQLTEISEDWDGDGADQAQINLTFADLFVIFANVLDKTKPMSNTLQCSQLNLERAVPLVDCFVDILNSDIECSLLLIRYGTVLWSLAGMQNWHCPFRPSGHIKLGSKGARYFHSSSSKIGQHRWGVISYRVTFFLIADVLSQVKRRFLIGSRLMD